MEQDDTHPGAKMASTATSAHSAETTTNADIDMEMEEADMTQWTEEEFEEKCTYIVKDTPWEAAPDSDAAMTTTRAEASLPRNLVFKHLAGSKEVRLTHVHALPDKKTFSQVTTFHNTCRQRQPCARTHRRESDVGHVTKRGSCLVVKFHTQTYT